MSTEPLAPPPVAIVGIGCMFPKAADGKAYWANILHKVDAIGPVPPTHWNPDDYYNADAKAPDLTYARRGGFLSPVDFPALDFGISPNTLEATDSTQLLGLLVARQALEDAGYGAGRTFDRNRVSVILGVTGTLPLVIPLGARLGHPHWRRALKEAGVSADIANDVIQRIGDAYVGWQEDSFPGLLGNVVAGRIANRLDLGGTNCVVDAACASSFSALHLATFELAAGRADMVLTGGMDSFNDIFMYMCFSKTPALSPTGDAKPFDASADGTILGEGLGCLVLKRLADAERDGDRIYAVIKSVGTSSDGKGHAIYAPSPAGQVRALRNAYQLADVRPETIELVEAHGTGTRAGDTAEVTALTEVYRSAPSASPWCALGSIKSQIGHTKAAAGAAGIIKAALALYHKVLPPTIKVTEPIGPLAPGASPFYVNTEPRPWLPRDSHPRRAAVSSFGFGGSNYHCVLEEYEPQKPVIDWDGQTQIVAFSAPTLENLGATFDRWPVTAKWEDVRLEAARSRAAFNVAHPFRALLVLEKDRTDVAKSLATARGLCEKLGDKNFAATPDGVYVGQGTPAGKLAMLFPGQGSQYVGMLRDLACGFPMMQQALAEADAADTTGPRLTDTIYPPPAFRDDQRTRQEETLRATQTAQPALGAVSVGTLRILAHFGVRPDSLGGHSYGELVALHAAGCIDAPSLHRISRLRGRLMAEQAGDRGAMLAVQAPSDAVEQVLREDGLQLVVANRNAPRQFVLSGATAEIRRAAEAFARRNVTAKVLPVSAAFHSPLVAEVRSPFQKALNEVSFAPPQVPVFANTTAGTYPPDAGQARALLAGQLAESVRFIDEIEAMYRAGVRTFLEVGPSNKLTGLVAAIIEGRPHGAMALDGSSGQRPGFTDLARALAQLAALGHAVDLGRWDEGALKTPAPKKPTLTVSICGANYVKPRSPRAATPKQQPTMPAPELPAPTKLPPQSAPALPPVPPVPPPVPQRPPPLPPTIPVAGSRSSMDQSFIAQALRSTQDNLAAMQQLGAQTAKLHEQFLENQNRALAVFQTLLDQQHRLVQGAHVGLPPVVPAAPALPAGPRDEAPPMAAAPPPPALRPLPPLAPELAPPAVVEQPIPRAEPPVVPPPVASPPTATADSRSAETLLAIVAEKTGYPAEMLGLDMELDADLGIDSIKRVEIFAALQEKLPEAPIIKPEHLGTLRTLRHVVAFLGEATAATPAPTAVPAPAAVADPVQPAAANADLAKLLLSVVAEKTGYPAEMLGLDMELDADLGIDSIKRVEIFAALQEKLPEAPVIKPEHLGTLRTLRHVVGFLGAAAPAETLATADPKPAVPSPSPQPTIAVEPSPPPAVSGALKRYTLRPAALPDGAHKPIALPEHAEIWITPDDGGLAAALRARLSLLGYQPRMVTLAEIPTLQPRGSLGGLVVLSPTVVDDRFLWDAFRLLQRAASGLRQAGKAGGAVFLTVSRMDGAFGLEGSLSPETALAGGLAGLAKTVAEEWPEVHGKALDLAPDLADPDEAVLVVAEELLRAGPREVGIGPAGRRALEIVPSALEPADWSPPLARGDVVVISGGARGVTAATAIALARTFAPTLVLLGRSAEPRPEPDWLAPLREETDIKRALLARADGKVAPREIGEQCRSWLANREMLHTLDRIREAGATGVYRSVDVRDANAARHVLADVRAEYGPIRGIIHGAGVIADRRIEDQTQEQFDAVYGTKVLGLRSLLAATAADDLRVLALFSSSTGRFGRTGQVAYAVANEVLNKTAQAEARRRPSCRVVALNWGPWDGGMVTPALRGVFANEGVGLIPLAAGADQCIREIGAARDRNVEVVLLAGEARPVRSDSTEHATVITLDPAFERTVSIDQYPVLRAHVLANRAVLPMALTVELLAHGALHGNPGLMFHGFDDLRILKGVRLLEEQAARLRVLAGKARKQDGAWRVPVELRSAGETQDVLHARGTVVLTAGLPKATASVPEVPVHPYARDVGEAYRDLLFHGPELHGIQRIDGMAHNGLSAWVKTAPPPATWIKQPLRGTWLADPLALDCAFQLMILWSHENRGAFSLPSFTARYRQYRRSFPADGVAVKAVVRESDTHRAVADLWFVDRAGTVVAHIDGYECVIDTSLAQAFRRNQFHSKALPSV